MCILFLAKLKGEEGLFSEGLLGEKEGAWWDLKEQMVVIREQKSLSFCKILNHSTTFLLFIRSHYK